MKKRLAMLLVAVFALTCAFTALSASAASYTDQIDLLPAEDEIKVNGGVPLYELKDGKLYLTRDGADNIAWPSIIYEVNLEVDLSETPYLHMNFETSGVGDRGVNGHINYSIGDGEVVSAQLSAIGANNVDAIDDYRDSADVIADLAKFLGTNETIYIHSIDLSVYGGMGETIVWNTLALASSGEGTDEPSEEPSEEPSDEPTSEEPSDEPSEEPSEEPSAEPTSDESAASGTNDPSSDKTDGDPSESKPTDSSKPANDAGDSSAPADESSDSNLWLIIGIVAAVVVIGAVVVVVIIKKKK